MTDGIESSEKVSRKVFRRFSPLIFILWILFVLYPNPLNLIIGIHRVLNLNADPGAVEYMRSDLPSAPVDIEKVVLARIPYRLIGRFTACLGIVPPLNKCWRKERGIAKAELFVTVSQAKTELDSKRVIFFRSFPLSRK
jgi:hypothetical protein